MCCETLSSPAIAWLTKPQAEERREWQEGSASKPWVTAASGSCRLKSAATWGSNRKAGEHQLLVHGIDGHVDFRLAVPAFHVPVLAENPASLLVLLLLGEAIPEVGRFLAAAG